MKTLFFGLVLMVLSLGCRKSSSNSNISSNEIFPDKVGDTWHYLVYDTTITNNIPWAFSQYYLDVSIIADTTLPGGIMATIWKYQYPGFADTNIVIRKGDTIRFLNNSSYLSLMKQYVIPFEVNSSWPNPLCNLSDVRVIERSGIMVGQTNFLNAFHISANSGCPDFSFRQDDWLVDNIGLVQSYFNPSGSFIITTHITNCLLMSYSLK